MQGFCLLSVCSYGTLRFLQEYQSSQKKAHSEHEI